MDLNTWLNVAALLALVVASLGLGVTRRKDGTIADLNAAVEAKGKRLHALEGDLQGLSDRATAAEEKARECEKAVVKWEARYEELKQYTAREAVTHFEEMMRDHSAAVAERHALMIGHLEAIDKTMHKGFEQHGELVLKSLEVLSAIDERTRG